MICCFKNCFHEATSQDGYFCKFHSEIVSKDRTPESVWLNPGEIFEIGYDITHPDAKPPVKASIGRGYDLYASEILEQTSLFTKYSIGIRFHMPENVVGYITVRSGSWNDRLVASESAMGHILTARIADNISNWISEKNPTKFLKYGIPDFRTRLHQLTDNLRRINPVKWDSETLAYRTLMLLHTMISEIIPKELPEDITDEITDDICNNCPNAIRSEIASILTNPEYFTETGFLKKLRNRDFRFGSADFSRNLVCPATGYVLDSDCPVTPFFGIYTPFKDSRPYRVGERCAQILFIPRIIPHKINQEQIHGVRNTVLFEEPVESGISLFNSYFSGEGSSGRQ